MSAARTALVVDGGRTLRGRVVAPPDKSITHRALFTAALGEGASEITPVGGGRDNRATLGALAALGVDVVRDGDRARIRGVGGPLGLTAPRAPIDCMNSGTTMRFLAGILAGTAFEATLTGDASLSSRPMTRLSPIEAMGAGLSGRGEGGRIFPPLVVRGGRVRGGRLRGADHVLPVASAQVKSALIYAGLWADGPSTIREPMRSRDHTERMLAALGAPISVDADGLIHVAPISAPWRAPRIDVAPDLSSAAFLVGAAIVTGSDDLVVETATNPTRAGILDVLTAMGAVIERTPVGAVNGEPVERLRVVRAVLSGVEVGGELALRAIDELPLVAGLAAFARGTTVIRDAAELRIKETDRLAAMHAVIEALGGTSTQTPDGLIIEGRPEALRGAEVDGRGDHRIAMTAAVMGLGLRSRTRVCGAEHVDVSFPGFAGVLAGLGAVIDEEVIDEGARGAGVVGEEVSGRDG
ncbi:3-phosphoshikimate 1-carboxyvinyltransferase [Myxococcota bacterium]|nr:3-phosphoshikimate 1-carboxyvinyltransferase [Myxococcota bacterium]